MNTENELFGELHEQEENGLFGNEHKRQYEAQQEALHQFGVSSSLPSVDPLDDENSEIHKIGREIAEMSDEEFEENCKALEKILKRSRTDREMKKPVFILKEVKEKHLEDFIGDEIVSCRKKLGSFLYTTIDAISEYEIFLSKPRIQILFR